MDILSDKIILFDIDGTIRGHRSTGDVIDGRLLPLLGKLKKKDYTLAIVTGRPYMFYKEYVDELLEGTQLCEEILPFTFVIYENGHRAYINGVHTNLLSDGSKQELERLRQFIAKIFQAFGCMWVNKYNIPLLVTYPKEAQRGEGYISLVDVAKVSLKQEEQIYGDLKGHLEELLIELGLENLTLHSTSPSHMTIEAKDSTKLSAVNKIVRGYSDIIFCCDSQNDLELARDVISKGGKVVCPANAIDSIKEIASFVAKAQHGAGICEYLERLAQN